MAKDPVFKKAGKWYHWDEVWTDPYGPFDTEEEAREGLECLYESLESGRE